VREDIIVVSPSLPLWGIPHSLFFERGTGLHPLPEGRGNLEVLCSEQYNEYHDVSLTPGFFSLKASYLLAGGI
jgi:hypothetical protein